MGEHSENQAEQKISVEEAAAIGRKLRQAREKCGLTVADIATVTKFAPKQIEALEAGEYQREFNSQTAYMRGFVRNYARVVQIDPATLLNVMPQAQAIPIRQSFEPIDEPLQDRHFAYKPGSRFWLIGAIVIVIAGLAYLAWHLMNSMQHTMNGGVEDIPIVLPIDVNSDGSSSTILSVPVVTEPVKTEPAPAVVEVPVIERSAVPVRVAPPLPLAVNEEKSAVADPQARSAGVAVVEEPRQALSPANDNVPLQLKFSDDAWVEIRDKHGKVLVSKINQAGSRLKVDGDRPLSLIVGNARNVTVYDGTELVELTTRPGSEVARLTLD